MLRYLIHRLALMPLTLIGITFLVFALSRFLPGGPLERQLWSEMKQSAFSAPAADIARLTDEQWSDLRSYYGLEKPMLPAYLHWLSRLAHFDLGTSLRYQEPVSELVAARFPISLIFAFSALLFSYGVCVPIGLLLAYRPLALSSRLISGAILILAAVPSYVCATLLFLYPAARFGWFPLGGLMSEDFSSMNRPEQWLDILSHAALPLFAYLIGHTAVMSYLMRNHLEEHLGSECMRMARAKGASHGQAVLRHAFPLSVLPLVSQFGSYLALIVGGSFIIERIFNIDGMGLLGYEALVERDYPLVLGLLTIVSVLHLVGNLVSDLCLALLDPRIRWDEAR